MIVSPFPPPHQNLSVVSLSLSVLTGVREDLKVILICISLSAEDDKHFLRYLLVIFIYSFEDSVQIHSSFLIGLLFPWHCFLSFLCILNVNPVRCGILPLCGLPFYSVDCFLCHTKCFHFMKSHLSDIDLNSCANGVQYRKSFLVRLSCRTLPMFVCLILAISVFQVSHLIYWKLNYYEGI